MRRFDHRLGERPGGIDQRDLEVVVLEGDDHGAGIDMAITWNAFPKELLRAYGPLTDGEAVPAGDTVVRAIHTPGHSPDHLAFRHEPSATIFTGDLVVQGSSMMIHWSRGGDLGQAARQMPAARIQRRAADAGRGAFLHRALDRQPALDPAGRVEGDPVRTGKATRPRRRRPVSAGDAQTLKRPNPEAPKS